jgi:Dolichyl-phosphate-mannose-protein mannosyltransferase
VTAANRSAAAPAPSEEAALELLMSLAQQVDTRAEAEPEPARRRRLGRPPWPLMVVLAVQAALSLRLVWSNTAFTDEALYLWAGHMEWDHLLHGMPIPAFPTYFSGAPAFYPLIGAIADSIGGLAAARILSLCFMLGATSMLWATTSRLFGKRAAFFAAGLWVSVGPTQKLGAFATFDAIALFLISAAAWAAIRPGPRRDATGWAAAVGVLLLAANTAKYATALFDPVVISLAGLTARRRPGGKPARMRTATSVFCLVAGSIAVWELATAGNGYYITGIEATTLNRAPGNATVATVLSDSARWTGIIVILALAAVAIAVATRSAHAPMLAVLACSAFLVPLEQAHIRTTTSLDKHVAFGAWFAAIAAGHAVSWITARLKGSTLRSLAASACAIALVYPAQLGMAQAQKLFGWANAYDLIIAFRGELRHETGNVLIDSHSTAEYYLAPTVAWKHWSSTSSLILPSGRAVGAEVGTYGDPHAYERLISRGYFSLVELNSYTISGLAMSLANYLDQDPAYHVVATGPYGNGRFIIWKYMAHGAKK